MLDNQKKGMYSHIMSAADTHTRCELCRTSDIVNKPFSFWWALTTDSSPSRHSSIGSDGRPTPGTLSPDREGAGVLLEVVVAVFTDPRDSTAVTQTEPRMDSVADEPLCKQGEDKRPLLDPSWKRVREQKGPSVGTGSWPSWAQAQQRQRPRPGPPTTAWTWIGCPGPLTPAGVQTGCPRPLVVAGEKIGRCRERFNCIRDIMNPPKVEETRMNLFTV